ncbi:hypothetical protein DL93DRAFT_2076007 [Clavulina sp. PMI_390]|nr:hypothetical protein DL93DRAFT_2076007 [Clavulina sp. PMI_390]
MTPADSPVVETRAIDDRHRDDSLPRDVPSSPFNDNIPTLDLKKGKRRRKARLHDNVPPSRPYDSSPHRRTHQRQSLPASKSSAPNGTPNPVGSHTTLPVAGVRERASTSSAPRIAHTLPNPASDLALLRPVARPRLPAKTMFTKDGEIVPIPPPSPELKPKVEPDDDASINGSILSQPQETSSRQNRRGKPSSSTQPGSLKRKLANRMHDYADEQLGELEQHGGQGQLIDDYDYDYDEDYGQRPARRHRSGSSAHHNEDHGLNPGHSLEAEIRYAEAEESTAAAYDLIERDQRSYSGRGSADSGVGFMKGGGAGGRPIYSSMTG